MPLDDPSAATFVFGRPELVAVMLATAIIAVIAAIRYRPRP